MQLNILYEDNHLIAVFKPAGILAQPDKTGDVSIFEEVKRHLKEKYKKPGNVFLGLVHRLDRPVSGIMLFAKTSKGAARLSEQFRNHQIEKTYYAMVVGKPQQDKGLLIDTLQKIKSKRLHSNNTYQKAKISEMGKEAVLHYEVVKSNGRYSLLKVKIDIGKFHQIRAQLSSAGFPILGDLKYGAPFALPDKSIALCATDLHFFTATKGKAGKCNRVKISIPLPEEWQKFTKLDNASR